MFVDILILIKLGVGPSDSFPSWSILATSSCESPCYSLTWVDLSHLTSAKTWLALTLLSADSKSNWTAQSASWMSVCSAELILSDVTTISGRATSCWHVLALNKSWSGKSFCSSSKLDGRGMLGRGMLRQGTEGWRTDSVLGAHASHGLKICQNKKSDHIIFT